MKTIIETATKESLYLFEDSKPIELTEDCLYVGNPIEFRDDCSKSTEVSIITDVTEPTGWFGRKYKYDGGAWVNNHPTDDGKEWNWDDTDKKWIIKE